MGATDEQIKKSKQQFSVQRQLFFGGNVLIKTSKMRAGRTSPELPLFLTLDNVV